ncbi:hypothetical protein H0H93_004650 [Arthromyces matolae]|nr:hypothetical protein H0H93_004650 [Arthromyces matolae]
MTSRTTVPTSNLSPGLHMNDLGDHGLGSCDGLEVGRDRSFGPWLVLVFREMRCRSGFNSKHRKSITMIHAQTRNYIRNSTSKFYWRSPDVPNAPGLRMRPAHDMDFDFNLSQFQPIFEVLVFHFQLSLLALSTFYMFIVFLDQCGFLRILAKILGPERPTAIPPAFHISNSW